MKAFIYEVSLTQKIDRNPEKRHKMSRLDFAETAAETPLSNLPPGTKTALKYSTRRDINNG